MVVRTYTKVNEALLARAPNLKVVGRGGVGIENIDVKACRARGGQVVYTPAANTPGAGGAVRVHAGREHAGGRGLRVRVPGAAAPAVELLQGRGVRAEGVQAD